MEMGIPLLGNVNPLEISEVVSHGLSVVCATCEHYWTARRGKQEKSCTTPAYCASPFGRDAFSEYKGPIPEDQFPNWCFVCGDASCVGICVEGKTRILGLCSKHERWLYTMTPKSMQVPLRRLILVRDDGRWDLDRLIATPRKPTLRETMIEVESYFAEQAERKAAQ